MIITDTASSAPRAAVIPVKLSSQVSAIVEVEFTVMKQLIL